MRFPDSCYERIPNSRSLPSLHLAVLQDDYETLKGRICSNTGINKRDKMRRTALHYAASVGTSSILEMLLDEGKKQDIQVDLRDEEGKSPIFKAIQCGSFACMKALADFGCQLNASDKMRRSPLHYAVMTESFEIFTYLIAKGANINAQDGGGFTPLHLSATLGMTHFCQVLINYGCQIDVKDILGRTALMCAVGSLDSEIIQLLLNNGASLMIRDYCHRGPVDYAWNAGPPIFEIFSEFIMRNEPAQEIPDTSEKTSAMEEIHTKQSLVKAPIKSPSLGKEFRNEEDRVSPVAAVLPEETEDTMTHESPDIQTDFEDNRSSLALEQGVTVRSLEVMSANSERRAEVSLAENASQGGSDKSHPEDWKNKDSARCLEDLGTIEGDTLFESVSEIKSSEEDILDECEFVTNVVVMQNSPTTDSSNEIHNDGEKAVDDCGSSSPPIPPRKMEISYTHNSTKQEDEEYTNLQEKLDLARSGSNERRLDSFLAVNYLKAALFTHEVKGTEKGHQMNTKTKRSKKRRGKMKN